jgi:hypothetical protein
MNMIPHCAEYLCALHAVLKDCRTALAQRTKRIGKPGKPTQEELDPLASMSTGDNYVSSSQPNTRPLNAAEGDEVVGESTYLDVRAKQRKAAESKFFEKWTIDWEKYPAAAEAFLALKRVISEGLCLAAYDRSLPVIVETDASAFCLGGICAQFDPTKCEMRPMSFFSE